jgi:hypothetical protein
MEYQIQKDPIDIHTSKSRITLLPYIVKIDVRCGCDGVMVQFQKNWSGDSTNMSEIN